MSERMSQEVLVMGLTTSPLSESETSILPQQVHLQRESVRALNTDIIFYILNSPTAVGKGIQVLCRFNT